MAFCINCGHELAESAKFCADCGATVESQQEGKSKRKVVYEGEIHKCPNCGEALKAFASNCPSCGYELRGVKPASAVQELAHKLEQIESQREYEKPVGVLRQQFRDQQISKTDEQKISLISSFAIPNTKEDLFEFLILASSNINLDRYDEEANVSASQKAVSDAWVAKFEQAFEKARLSFGHTQEFAKIQAIYDNRNAQIETAKRKGKLSILKYIVLIFLCVGFVFAIAITILTLDSKSVDKENQRLESIVSEVYEAIEDENYTLAKAKAANIVFSGSTSKEGDQAAEKWEKTRAELLAIIEEAEKASNNKPNQIPSTAISEEPSAVIEPSTVVAIATTGVDVSNQIADFVDSYEKAEFDKFNSLASENGLADTRIYFECTLDKTEVLEADDTKSILGYFTDASGNQWLVQMHVIPIVTETYFDTAKGKEVVVKGAYSGYSKKKNMPVVILDEMLIVENGTVMNGMQKLLDE